MEHSRVTKAKETIALLRWPDGTLTNHSRDFKVNGRRGQGGLVVYEGEAKEVMELVLKYSGKGSDDA